MLSVNSKQFQSVLQVSCHALTLHFQSKMEFKDRLQKSILLLYTKYVKCVGGWIFHLKNAKTQSIFPTEIDITIVLFFQQMLLSTNKEKKALNNTELTVATKSYFTRYSCVVIVLFNTALCRSALSTVSFRKLVFLSFCDFFE